MDEDEVSDCDQIDEDEVSDWVRIYEDKVRACDRIDDSIGNAIARARDDKEINFALIDQ